MTRATPLFIGAALLALAGCTSGDGDPIQPLPNSGLEVTEGYPQGPYGTSKGSVIEDYAFPGYGRPTLGLGEARQQQLRLSDFYNASGDELYDAESNYPEGEPKPRAVVINVSAVWCGPCKREAAEILPAEYAEFQPQGMELLLVLADDLTPGDPADFENLDSWIFTFDVNYPSAIDPNRRLGALFDQNSFPANFLIDTRTMAIVEVVKGVPQESFWATLEDILHDE